MCYKNMRLFIKCVKKGMKYLVNYNWGDKLHHNKYMHTTYTYVTKLLQIQ
jgi:hypothetical protein